MVVMAYINEFTYMLLSNMMLEASFVCCVVIFATANNR